MCWGARLEVRNEGSKERWRIASLLWGQRLRTKLLLEMCGTRYDRRRLIADLSSRACKWPESSLTMTFEHQQSATSGYRVRLRDYSSKSHCSELRMQDEGHIKVMSCAWSGRGEFVGMKGRAYQHRPDFYLGSAGLRLSFRSVPNKVQATCNVGTPNPLTFFFPSPHIATFTLQARLTSFAPFARPVVSISLRR